jgi:DNA primase
VVFLKFSAEFIVEVRTNTEILDVVGQYVDLRRAGTYSYKGLCPFHREKTPSFTVNAQDQYFFCFGCHTGGDVIKFLQLMTGMKFPEVITELAKKAGMKLPVTNNFDSSDREAFKKKARLYEVMNRATEYFVERLWEPGSTHVRNYLRKRGVDDDVSRAFNLGYSLDTWEGLTQTFRKEGFDENLLKEAGLVKPRDNGRGVYDAFRGRLIIPVTDADGKTVAFGGRLLNPAAPEVPKYINSPLTPIYKKGEHLFGLPQARPYIKALGCAYIVEGYFDLIALFAKGIKNVVASLGTAFTQTQANLLRGRAKELFLLFDGDRAGREAAKKALPKLLNAEIDGRVIVLPHEHDPDTFIREEGVESLFRLLERSLNVFDYTVDYLLSTYPDTLIGQAQAVREIKELLAEVPDSAKGQLLRRKFADKLGIGYDQFSLQQNRNEPAPFDDSSQLEESDFDNSAANILKHAITYPETQMYLRELVLYWPLDSSTELYREMLNHLDETGVVIPSKFTLRDDKFMNLVSEASLTPRIMDPPTALAVFEEYATRMKRKGINTALNRISRGIRDAEAEGDTETLQVLLKEHGRLIAEKKDLESDSEPSSLRLR